MHNPVFVLCLTIARPGCIDCKAAEVALCTLNSVICIALFLREEVPVSACSQAYSHTYGLNHMHTQIVMSYMRQT